MSTFTYRIIFFITLSLGGWVATRASGMKKNVYGNIEDIMLGFRMVTPKGVLERCCDIPRMSCGPDFMQLVLGSEGNRFQRTSCIGSQKSVRGLPIV